MGHDGVSVVLKSREGKYLLQLRDNKKEIVYPGMWALFGWGVENGEAPWETAAREMEEELGLRLKEDNFTLVLVSRKPGGFRQYNFICNACIDITELKLMEGQDMKLFSRVEVIFMKHVPFKLRQISPRATGKIPSPPAPRWGTFAVRQCRQREYSWFNNARFI